MHRGRAGGHRQLHPFGRRNRPRAGRDVPVPDPVPQGPGGPAPGQGGGSPRGRRSRSLCLLHPAARPVDVRQRRQLGQCQQYGRPALDEGFPARERHRRRFHHRGRAHRRAARIRLPGRGEHARPAYHHRGRGQGFPHRGRVHHASGELCLSGLRPGKRRVQGDAYHRGLGRH